jgi:hypothetical protein
VAYAAFCFVVATTIRPLGVSGCFALAAVLALCVQAAAVADALALETIRNGCYPDRPAPCTMNLHRFIAVISRIHQLRYLRASNATKG